MNILASANNPGGANALLPVVRSFLLRGDLVTLVLEGVAQDVFAKSGFNFLKASEKTEAEWAEFLAKENFELFLASTSLGPTIDKNLLRFCQAQKIPSVYILDSWVNYTQRFSDEVGDFKYMPDYICVTDETNRAHMLAENFPAEKIIITGNPYFDNFTHGITIDSADKEQILFISQPLPEQDELIALNDLLAELQTINFSGTVLIRLHPRDEPNKFQEMTKNSTINLVYDQNPEIKESISQAGLIFGINSMVLFQAALAGKVVISYQPNLKEGTDCLPSNAMGLSHLVQTKVDLTKALQEYLVGKLNIDLNKINNPTVQEIKKEIATEKVITFIDSVFKK